MRTLIPFILAALLTACASSGRKLDQSKVDLIKQDVTTRQEVLKLIGSPENITKDGSGNTTFLYQYFHASAKGANFVPVVNLFAGGVNTKSQSVMIQFGSDDVVKSITSSMGASEVGENASASSPDKPGLRPVADGKRPR